MRATAASGADSGAGRRARGRAPFRAARVTRDEAETRRLGERLGRTSRPGDVVCLSGMLGSGKTVFVQGFARGAGYRGGVASPTFAIARRYRARGRTLHHLDLYRVRAEDLPNLALEEYLDDPRGVCLIEWPEVARGLLPPERLEIRFRHRRPGRALRLRAVGPRWRAALRRMGGRT